MSENSYEAICFEIISYAGTARSCFMEAIEAAKAGEDTAELLKEGQEAYKEASMAHQKALMADANDELKVGLLLVHAETILSSAEIIKDLSETIIELIKK